MTARTKIFVLHRKNILFYISLVALCLIILFLFIILLGPNKDATDTTILVKNGCAILRDYTSALSSIILL